MKEPPAEYVAASRIKVSFPKPYLTSEEDVEAYVDALRRAYLEKVAENKRISV